MASKLADPSLLVALAFMIIHWGIGASAQSGCTSTLMRLTPCISYVNGNSSTPSATCCSQLSSVVSSQPRCLCLLLNGGASSYGIYVNQTLALALPGACTVQTPPSSQCNDANGQNSPATPAGSPKGTSPSDSSNGTLKNPKPTSDTPAGGSKTTGVSSTAAAASVNASFHLAFLLFVAFYVLSAPRF